MGVFFQNHSVIPFKLSCFAIWILLWMLLWFNLELICQRMLKCTPAKNLLTTLAESNKISGQVFFASTKNSLRKKIGLARKKRLHINTLLSLRTEKAAFRIEAHIHIHIHIFYSDFLSGGEIESKSWFSEQISIRSCQQLCQNLFSIFYQIQNINDTIFVTLFYLIYRATFCDTNIWISSFIEPSQIDRSCELQTK